MTDYIKCLNTHDLSRSCGLLLSFSCALTVSRSNCNRLRKGLYLVMCFFVPNSLMLTERTGQLRWSLWRKREIAPSLGDLPWALPQRQRDAGRAGSGRAGLGGKGTPWGPSKAGEGRGGAEVREITCPR